MLLQRKSDSAKFVHLTCQFCFPLPIPELYTFEMEYYMADKKAVAPIPSRCESPSVHAILADRYQIHETSEAVVIQAQPNI